MAYIISEQYEAITRELLQLDRGVTLLEGKGAWSGKDKRVILCAFGRRQIIPVKKLSRLWIPTPLSSSATPMKFWARASDPMTPRACNGGAAMRKTVLAAVLAR